MKVIEKRIDQVIGVDTYQAHLVESVIRSLIKENKLVHVIVEEIEDDKEEQKC